MPAPGQALYSEREFIAPFKLSFYRNREFIAMSRLSFVLCLAGLLLVGPVFASLSMHREVVLTDPSGGTLTMETVATLELPGSEAATTAVFHRFQVNPERRVVDGQVVRRHVRDGEVTVSFFDGSLKLSSAVPDQSALMTIEFQDLVVELGGDGPELSGFIVVDGRVFDVSTAPRVAATILRRLLRYFAYA